MDKLIFQSCVLKGNPEKAFSMVTENQNLEKWLAVKADVEPAVGGKYELFWDPAHPNENSTKGCRVLAVEPPFFINFEWKGAKQHEAFMNNIQPLTNVSVFIVPEDGGHTKVMLVHTGWKNTPEWDEARHWFEKAWQGAFEQLAKL